MYNEGANRNLPRPITFRDHLTPRHHLFGENVAGIERDLSCAPSLGLPSPKPRHLERIRKAPVCSSPFVVAAVTAGTRLGRPPGEEAHAAWRSPVGVAGSGHVTGPRSAEMIVPFAMLRPGNVEVRIASLRVARLPRHNRFARPKNSGEEVQHPYFSTRRWSADGAKRMTVRHSSQGSR